MCLSQKFQLIVFSFAVALPSFVLANSGATDEESGYFEASSIAEYAHFLNDTVGNSGYLRLADPRLDGNNPIWGSDSEEDASSSTSLVRSSSNGPYQHGFDLVDGFYSYSARYEMPENVNLGYQYLYWDFFPRAVTSVQAEPAVISRSYFSLWVASTADQRVGVELFFETGGKERLSRINVAPSSSLTNLKFRVSQVGKAVSRVSLNIIASVPGEQDIEFALLAFSDVPTTISTLPSWPDSTPSPGSYTPTLAPTTERQSSSPSVQGATSTPTKVPTTSPPTNRPSELPDDDAGATDEQSGYFVATTIEEYAHFLNDTVGSSGYLRLVDPILDGNNPIWGSDAEEDASSSTSLVRSSSNGPYQHGFDLIDARLGFYRYSARYEMPENVNLGYQYLYWDFFPKAVTSVQAEPAVISRSYFSLWVASTAEQQVGVELFFETGGKERLSRINVAPSSLLTNLKFPVSQVGKAVSRVSLNIITSVQGEQDIQFALLAFSDIPNTITDLPSWPDSTPSPATNTPTLAPTTERQSSSPSVQKATSNPTKVSATSPPTNGPSELPTESPEATTNLPTGVPTIESSLSPTVSVDTPTECQAHYPYFLDEITPYAMYRITDRVPSETNHKLSVLEAGGTMLSQTLDWQTSGQKLVGNLAVRTEFTLPPQSYIYIQNQYNSTRALDGDQSPVDASSFGRYFCFWMRFLAGSDITVTFVTSSTRQSYVNVRTASSEWANHCLDLSSTQVRPGKSPVDLSSLAQVLLTFTNQGSTSQSFVLEHTLMYFANEFKEYTTMPAIVDPSLVLRSDGQNGCEYLSGPKGDTVPPNIVPPKTPLAAYERSYSGTFPADSRLAVYVIEENSHWLALVHALKILGIQLAVTTSLQNALRHSTVLVYPEASIGRLSQEEKDAFATHSESHTVIFTMLSDPGLYDACGITGTADTQEYSYINFQPDVSDSPAGLFGCEKGTKLAQYDCPTGVDDSERYIKIWQDWTTPNGLGSGWPVQRLQIASQAEAISTYMRRVPVVTEEGTYVKDDDGYVFHTDIETNDVSISRKAGQSGGYCYVIGMDLGRFSSQTRNYDLQGVGKSYSSKYGPGLDMLIRLIRNIYRQSQPAVTLHPIPFGKRLAVMFTHDCDADRPDLWEMFANRENQAGIKGSFMIYTKLNRDAYDVPFFFPNEETLQRIVDLEHELGSHSVSHSPNFGKYGPLSTEFDLGTGTEEFTYGAGYSPKITCTDARDVFIENVLTGQTVSICSHPQYQGSGSLCNYYHFINGSPDQFECGLYETDGGTVMGELRVSKFLLDTVYKRAGQPERTTRSFRPGHLRYPSTLNEALTATGFSVSSVNNANELNTHLYFRMMFGHDGAAQNPNTASGLDLFEMPIQFDDLSYWPLRSSNSGGLDMATHTHHVAARIAKFGGTIVVLSHPSDEIKSTDGLPYTGLDKIEWEVEFAENVREYATFATLSEFGDFASARDLAQVDIQQSPVGYDIQLDLPAAIDGLTLEVPFSWICGGAAVLSQFADHLDSSVTLVVLDSLTAGTHVISCEESSRFRRRYLR